MLHDMSRMTSYHNAIAQNPQDFKDKVVLDVGCGTGILACWCAQAGARKVFAVEACSVAEQAELIVLRNGLSHVVEVIQGKIESIVLPEKVDVIISEWMGSFLLFESMLDTVLWARDNWLKEGGKLYPEIGRLYVAPLCFDRFFDKKVKLLNDVCGIDMSPIIPFARKELTAWGIRGRRVKAECVIAEPQIIKTFNIHSVASSDLLKITSGFKFTANRKANFHGFVAWFDVIFPAAKPGQEVILSTAPDKPVTHWRHDVFLMENEVLVDEGTEIVGSVRMTQNVWWKRHFDFDFSFNILGHEYYKLWST